MSTRSIKKDIAIIGLSGRFPQCNDVREFWNNLAEGKELIKFYTDEELNELGVDFGLINDERFVKSTSFLENAGNFDYSFFNYTKEEAELMDPQIRVLHQEVWHALEDAGCNPFSFQNKIGCYLAASDNLNWRAHVLFTQNEHVNSYLGTHVANPTTVNTLISYALNLKGPSYYLDTACSSSLVAVHIACRNLLLKECAVAVAGGASISSSPAVGYLHEEGLIFSKDGHCKAFDKDASGTVNGEGVGVVVLKRLEDALNDRDHIYGVIRATAVNNDGRRKIGYTAPSVSGQTECIKMAHQIADVNYTDISYVEAHGTGTRLGDPVEIEALNKAFNNDATFSCAIGSLKTNLGHLDAAAGVSGLIKTTLALQHKTLPPSLHYTQPNPEIDFKSGPFSVNDKLTVWESDKPRIAGVSSFGIGGTNAHAIVEEAPVRNEESSLKTHQLLVFSAKTSSSLEQYHTKIADYLGQTKMNLADLAYTLSSGRAAHRYRSFSVVENNSDYSGNPQIQTSDSKGKIAFLFSGQGSQYPEMGKQLYTAFPYFKSIMDRGFELLQKETGERYDEIMGYSSASDSEKINNTRYTQPIVFLTEYALAQLLLKLGVEPTQMIGHSLGEYVAACLSGVFTFEEGLSLVTKRATIMDRLEKGAMISVGKSYDELKIVLFSDVSVAAINTENSCVVSGKLDRIEAFSAVLDEMEASYSRLKTSHAFHSAMMNDMVGEFTEALKKVQFTKPEKAFISCLTGESIQESEVITPDYWIRHLLETVQFEKGLRTLLQEENMLLLEVGAGKSLITIARQNRNFRASHKLINLLKHPKEEGQEIVCFLNALGTIWAAGTEINWTEYFSGETRSKIAAPGYVFDAFEFPVKVNPLAKLADLNGINWGNSTEGVYTEWLYEQGWKEAKAAVKLDITNDADWAICLLPDNDHSETIQRNIRGHFANTVFVKKGHSFAELDENTVQLNPLEGNDFQELCNYLHGKCTGSVRIIHAWSTESDVNELENLKHTGYFSLIRLAQTLLANHPFQKISIDLLLTEAFNVTGEEEISAAKSLAIGALNVIAKEYDNTSIRVIELLEKDCEKVFENGVYPEKLKRLSSEMLAIRGTKIWEPIYEKTVIDASYQAEPSLKKEGVYLITGANGGMATQIAEFLLNNYQSKLILIGRGRQKNREKFEEFSSSILYIEDDLKNRHALGEKINKALTTFGGNLNGVFHTAGIGDFAGLINDRTQEHCEEVFAAKVSGTCNLLEVIDQNTVDFVLLFSSSSSVLAPYGQVAYVAANLFLNQLAWKYAAAGKIKSIQWDAWKETGMAVNAHRKFATSTAEELTYGISNANGIAIIQYALSMQSPEIIVSVNDFNEEMQFSRQKTLKADLESVAVLTDESQGSIDRPQLTVAYVEPESETEIILCDLWKKLFGFDKIGTQDDFFELGGDSLKAMTLLKWIHKALNIELKLGVFFTKSTIRELAGEIELANEVKAMKSENESKVGLNQIRI